MSRRMTSIGTLAAVFCILLISANPAMATDVAARSQAAQTDVRSTGISWQPMIDYKSAVLTVSGPDGAFLTREFNRGESIQIRVVDKQGNAFADGGYTWELSFAPVLEPAVKRALQDARESGDERAVADLKRQGKLPEGAVVSGYFRVRSGSIITPDKAESSAAVERTVSEPDMGDAGGGANVTSADKDQVILDDLIVDGSICVGLDCVNGESFGFDTLRLKENNLRIRAQDTSSSASFPTNDWQITFNDSSNGGANKFSIDDIDGGRTPFTIEAGARSNALYVESDGDIGIGTNNPVVDVHIKSGNTPTLRLEQDGSSGFTPQTWDVAGNETNFFIRDATNGSTLPFRIFPGAPSNALNIEASGDIGVGTTSPDADLDIESSTGPGVRLTNTGSGGGTWDLFVNANTSRLNVEFNDGNIPLKIDDGANNNLLQLGINGSDQVDITGNLVISGSCSDSGGPGCDAVFQPEYPLESLEEHAAFMWKNSYLPGVGPTPEDARWDLGRKSAGMLNELEKAHIYIEQLSATIADLQNRLEKLENGANE